MTLQTAAEPILDPGLPIVDAHHHLWLLPEPALKRLEEQTNISAIRFAPTRRRHARYLLDEFMLDLTSGHNVRASVYVESRVMYRQSGPEPMRSLGEVEFANGVAAMAASGIYGHVKACAGIVGCVDLMLGEAVEAVLIAHIQAGGGRYRGVRSYILHDNDPRILGKGVGLSHLLLDTSFRRGFKKLSTLGLSFDACLLEPQLLDLIELARAFPETSIILNHVGMPVGIGQYEGKREERFPIWRENIRSLSQCANVTVKLGGLGTAFGGFNTCLSTPPATSAQLAEEWRPYVETCIEAFGADRCMFESNFPVDAAAGNYAVLWNAFKRLAAGASNGEKNALFSGTAIRVYRLEAIDG